MFNGKRGRRTRDDYDRVLRLEALDDNVAKAPINEGVGGLLPLHPASERRHRVHKLVDADAELINNLRRQPATAFPSLTRDSDHMFASHCNINCMTFQTVTI